MATNTAMHIKEEPRDDFVVSNVSVIADPDEATPINIEPRPEFNHIKQEPNDFLVYNGISHTSSFHNQEISPLQKPMETVQVTAEKPKRVRKRKVKTEVEGSQDNQALPATMVQSVTAVKQELKQETLTGPGGMKERKKRDRFKGMTEEEVLQRLLPDHLAPDLDIIIIGINPGLTAAFVGHHYAGPGNHFWKCLLLSGLIPTQMNAYDDYKLLEHGIGFTNIVARTTRGSADLSKKEIQEGAQILTEKILKYKPKIAVFNGKGIYEVFCGHKKFYFGKQPEGFPGAPDTTVFVMPSSSARCTQLPRAVDKVPFYEALRKYRDYLRGRIPCPDDSEVTFPDLELKTAEPKKNRIKMEEGEVGQVKQEMPSESEPKKKAPRKPRKKKGAEEEHSNSPSMNGFYNDSTDPSMSNGDISHPAHPSFPTASVQSKVAAWQAANMAHDRAEANMAHDRAEANMALDIAEANMANGRAEANIGQERAEAHADQERARSSNFTLESLLPPDSVLVKDEGKDLSKDLAAYGLSGPLDLSATTAHSLFTPHAAALMSGLTSHTTASTSAFQPYPGIPPYFMHPGHPPMFNPFPTPGFHFGHSPYFPSQAPPNSSQNNHNKNH